MTSLLALINGSLLAAIGLLHLYWMVGGRWGLAQVLPTKETGEQVLRPGPVACAVVAAGLCCFALYYCSLGLHFPLGLPFQAEQRGIWILAATFSLRAIGDFRYTGFFRKVKNTEFARMDKRWYVPLCVWLGATSFWLAIA